MAKKKDKAADSPIIQGMAAAVETSRRGETDLSKFDGVLSQDAKPPAGVELEPVRDFALAALTPHPLNVRFFRELPPDEREALKKDIEARGVLVPVIATADGVILSGHRRVIIAGELGRAFVPVQFIKGELTPAQEREFLIKDNLLRRHLTAAEKEALIIELYGREMDQDRRGGDRKSEAAKIKISSETLIGQIEPLHVRVEQETGIPAGTAGRMIAKIRKERQGAAPEPAAGEMGATAHKPAPDRLKAIRAHLGKIVKLLDGADQQTIDAAIIEVVGILDEIAIDPRYSGEVKTIIEKMRA